VVRLVSQFSDETKVLQHYRDFRGKLEKFSPIELDVEVLPPNPQYLSDIPVFRHLADATPYILGQSLRYARDWSWLGIIILFITFFVMLEGRMLARRAAAIFGPSEEVQKKATEVLFEMATHVRNYLVWRTIINIGLAAVMFVIYYAAGLTQPLTWALLLLILNYVPYFGPVLASIPPFLDAFIFTDPMVAVGITAAFWIVIVLEGYLIVPLLMGRNMDLNATTVMVACLFWELVWPGMTGLFLAMPIMAGIKAILHHVPEWRVWADLMSSADDVDKPPEAQLILPGDSPNGKADLPTVDIKPGSPARIDPA
jgi:predicted PurR-regulated permease PerM